MVCNIIAHFDGSNIRKSHTVGIAYKILKNNSVLCEGRNAFIGMTAETRNYASFNELIQRIINEQTKGNIPKGSNITFVGDQNVFDFIQNKTQPKGIQKNILQEIKANAFKLEIRNSLRYKPMDKELSYCNTKIPQYLSKVACFSAMELLKHHGKIKDVDKLLDIINLKNQLNITNELALTQANTIDNNYGILKGKDFINYKVVISTHCLEQWNDRAFAVKTKEEILRYILEASLMNGGITHEYESFYCFQGEVVCVCIFNENQIHVTTSYGTISNNPALSDMSHLKDVVRRYGKLNLNLV